MATRALSLLLSLIHLSVVIGRRICRWRLWELMQLSPQPRGRHCGLLTALTLVSLTAFGGLRGDSAGGGLPILKQYFVWPIGGLAMGRKLGRRICAYRQPYGLKRKELGSG